MSDEFFVVKSKSRRKFGKSKKIETDRCSSPEEIDVERVLKWVIIKC
jgi:hypothetical protein